MVSSDGKGISLQSWNSGASSIASPVGQPRAYPFPGDHHDHDDHGGGGGGENSDRNLQEYIPSSSTQFLL